MLTRITNYVIIWSGSSHEGVMNGGRLFFFVETSDVTTDILRSQLSWMGRWKVSSTWSMEEIVRIEGHIVSANPMKPNCHPGEKRYKTYSVEYSHLAPFLPPAQQIKNACDFDTSFDQGHDVHFSVNQSLSTFSCDRE